MKILQTAVLVCCFSVTSEFESQVQITLNNTATIQCALFPMQCFALCEADKFRITFNHDLQPTRPGAFSCDPVLRFCHVSTAEFVKHKAKLNLFGFSFRSRDAAICCAREVHEARSEVPFLWPLCSGQRSAERRHIASTHRGE